MKRKTHFKYSKDDAADRLLRAVADWVNANGGSAVVAGGIGIQQYPDDLKYNYQVVVRVTGCKPVPQTTS